MVIILTKKYRCVKPLFCFYHQLYIVTYDKNTFNGTTCWWLVHFSQKTKQYSSCCTSGKSSIFVLMKMMVKTSRITTTKTNWVFLNCFSMKSYHCCLEDFRHATSRAHATLLLLKTFSQRCSDCCGLLLPIFSSAPTARRRIEAEECGLINFSHAMVLLCVMQHL